MSKQSEVLLQNLPLHMALEAVNFPVNPVGRKIELSYTEMGTFREDTLVEQLKGRQESVYVVSTVTDVELRIRDNGEAVLLVHFNRGHNRMLWHSLKFNGRHLDSIGTWDLHLDIDFDNPTKPWEHPKKISNLSVLVL